MSSFASTIRAARIAQGMTQVQLADAMNMTHMTVVRLEKGEAGAKALAAAAAALDLDVDELCVAAGVVAPDLAEAISASVKNAKAARAAVFN